MAAEQLIELVKRHPVLYNTGLADYRDHSIRNGAWKEIAKEMRIPIDELKHKWGKIRNCFTNALKRRRRKNRDAATALNPWKFEKQMEYLLPFVEVGKRTTTNIPFNEVDINNDGSDYELQFLEETSTTPVSDKRTPTPTSINIKPSTSRASVVRTSTPSSSSSITTRYRRKNDDDNTLLKETKRRKRAREMDETDYFFLSMSRDLKKLPEIDQAEIKFQIHKLIYDSEMKILREGKVEFLREF